MELQISLAPEVVFQVGSLPVTNSMLGALAVTSLMCLAAVAIGKGLSPVPGRVQAALEMVYAYFYGLAETVIGRSDATRFVFPYVVSLFFFILLSYWLGLIPGISTIGVYQLHDGHEVLVPLIRPPINDLNTVGALALCSVAYVQVMGVKYAGLKNYSTSFFNFSGPIQFFTGLLEIVTTVSRLISFTFRLFGNVFAGEVLLAVVLFLTVSLTPFFPVLPIPFLVLELFVGVIQAFVFCFLTIVLTSLAVNHGGSEHGVHSSKIPLTASL